MTLDEAQAQLDTIENQLVQQIAPADHESGPNSLRAYIQPMREAITHKSSSALWLLLAAVLGLMLIACVNLANAQLSRVLSRRREAAVRSALGASRSLLLSNSLAETLLLTGAGGFAGIALAIAAVGLFVRFCPIALPRLAEVHVNLPILLFSILLVITAALLFGLLPAVQLLQADPQDALRQTNVHTQGSRQSRRLRQWLVGFQVFACTALLLVTGLFAKSLFRLLHNAKGFQTSHIALAEVDLSGKEYAQDQKRSALDDALLRKLRALPGVQSAALVSAMPLTGETWIDGVFRADRPTKNPPLANVRWISPGYFETIREPLIAGRVFDDRDRNLPTVIISQATARAVWPHENPLGHRIRKDGKTYAVVGIVADARNNSLQLAPANMLYFHYKENPPDESVFLVRGLGNAHLLLSRLRQSVWNQVPDVEIESVKTLDSELAESVAPERFQATVLLSFGAAALLLAMLGIYGVLSYSVAGRQQEIGLRMALGATRQNIYALTMGEAVRPVCSGLILGWAASALSGRAIQSLLYDVKTVDLPVSLMVIVIFVGAAMAAAFLPARRAASVDPMQALRAE